jgi:hypothetical protein
MAEVGRDGEAPLTWRERGRLAALLTGGAWLLLGPIGPQVFDVGDPWLPRWAMFSTFGQDICAVAYWRQAPGGTRERLDRYALLGEESRWKARKSVRKVTDVAGGLSLGRRLCQALGEGADVRMRLRCREGTAWAELVSPEQNACTMAVPGRSLVPAPETEELAP